MQTQPDFGFKDLMTHLVGGIVKAVCEQDGETSEQQFLRSQAATFMVMAFMPRDVVEAMIAGHIVMLHEMMVHDVQATLRGSEDKGRRVTRAGIVAMDRAFGDSLARLDKYRSRPSEGQRETRDAAPERTDGGDTAGVEQTARKPVARPSEPARDPRTRSRVRPAQMAAEMSEMEQLRTYIRLAGTNAGLTPTADMLKFGPAPGKIADSLANTALMAALEAADPVRFARTIGVEPSPAYIAAAAVHGVGLGGKRTGANGGVASRGQRSEDRVPEDRVPEDRVVVEAPAEIPDAT
jgi:hypothetical protein